MHPQIDGYLTEVLAPQLHAAGIPPAAIERVQADIAERLTALSYHWPDPARRATLLFPGVEEATFYRPVGAPLDIRALVVMGVRNSHLEYLQRGVHPPAGPPLLTAGQGIGDADMPAITGAAIRWFAQTGVLPVAVPPASDPFGPLEDRYPRTWFLLAALATLLPRERDRRLENPPVGRPPAVPARGVEDVEWNPRGLTLRPVRFPGIAEEWDTGLVQALHPILRERTPHFLSSSWRSITRHPEKLYRVLESILARDGLVVTANYYLTPTYIARRTPLLRPGHTTAEEERNLHKLTGLQPVHRSMLQSAIQSMV